MIVFSIVNKVLHKNQTIFPNDINSDNYIAHRCTNLSQKILDIHHNGISSITLSWGILLVEVYCMSMTNAFE